MQSGISASQELAHAFTNFLKDDGIFALLVTIADEQLKPLAEIARTSPRFEDNLTGLEPHITDSAALYAILRRHETAPYLTLATYVPDLAKVRQKTLFASTRLTLTRELGSEHFRDALFCTSADELTAAGFQRHDAHAALEAPLTEEERALGAVKTAEAEASRGTGAHEIHLSKHMAVAVGDNVVPAIEAFVSGSRTLVVLTVDQGSETVVLEETPTSPASLPEMVSALSATEPRFSFFRYTHTNGTPGDSVIFTYSCPPSAGMKAIKSRMMYPLMKRPVLEVAARHNLVPAKQFHIEDLSELTEKTVLDELFPPKAASAGFSRPKRPGR